MKRFVKLGISRVSDLERGGTQEADRRNDSPSAKKLRSTPRNCVFHSSFATIAANDTRQQYQFAYDMSESDANSIQ